MNTDPSALRSARDHADTVLAVADDFMSEHADETIDADDVYDWLVAQAQKIRQSA